MAINPSVQLAPQIVGPNANYLYGSVKNQTAPGANDGTPYKAVRGNDIFGFQQFILKAAGIVPSEVPDTALDKNSSQYAQAILHLIMAAATFDDTGVADAYLLGVVGDNPAPASYTPNMTAFFTPTNTNTGASTANIEGLGIKDIVIGGVALSAGFIVAGVRTSIIFDSINDRFELVSAGSNLGQALAIDLTLTGAAASPPDINTLVKESIMKAWVNFNGVGTLTVRDSFNVASVDDNGTGNYTPNWDTDFADANYSVTFGSELAHIDLDGAPLAGSITVETFNSAFASFNATFVMVNAIGRQ